MNDSLIRFLAEAKYVTYASNDSYAKQTYPDGASGYTFSKAKFLYSDRYYGGEPFIGEELLFDNGIAVWGMNYTGKLIGGNDSVIQSVYSFLQESLRHRIMTLPLRGPELFTDEGYEYRSSVEGDIDFFQGKEMILTTGDVMPVYLGYFHGGRINRIKG